MIGTDESFFGEDAASRLRDLYTEREGTLDDDETDDDIDLTSLALQVWNSATAADRKIAERLPAVVSASRYATTGTGSLTGPPGLISYLRFNTAGGETSDAIVRVDAQGSLISQSITAAFRAAACAPDTPAAPAAARHFDLIEAAARFAVQEQTNLGGQMGSLRSTRRKVYERLRVYRESLRRRNPMFAEEKLERLDPAFNAIAQYPLREVAREALGRQLNLGIKDDDLVESVVLLYQDERLCNIRDEDDTAPEPQIVCSLGFVRPTSTQPSDINSGT